MVSEFGTSHAEKPERTEPVIRAATRDASWYAHPGTAHKYHVILETDERGSTGAFIANCSSACGIPITVADYETLDAREIPSYLRCGRPGCKARWPE